MFFGRGLDHGVFAADVINGGRFTETLADPPQNVDVRQCRFDHDDVGAFVDIERDFAQRFFRIGGVHLIRTAIAELRRAFRGVTKRSVENRGKFGGVAHDAGLIETVRIQCFANGADAAVHHVAGRNHVGAGARVGKRRLDQKIDRLVVEDMEMIAIHPGDPAMTVAHVFAETHIGQHDYLRTFFLDCAQALLHDTIVRVSAAGLFIFLFRNSEQEEGLQPEIARTLRFIDNLAN